MADNRDNITVTMRLRGAARFAAEVRANRREIQKFGKAVRQADKDGVGLRVALGGVSTGLRLTALGLVVAGQGAVALTVGTVGLVSALGPLLGLVGALPGGLALVAQAFGVVKLAGAGVGDALGPLGGSINVDKFALLTPAAQDFVLALDAMKGGVRGLQADLSEGLFPGVLAGLIAARPALDALHDPLVDTARGTGAWAERLGLLVGSGGFLADLRSQARFNNVQLGRLGDTGLSLVGVFRNLMVGSRGLVSWVVRGGKSFAAWADEATAAGRASGGLQRGFHTVQVTTQRVVLLFWRTGKALLNIGRIGKREVGDGLLVILLRGATALERWTRSEAGIRKIGAAFAWSRSVLAGVADFMDRAAHTAGPGVADLLRNIVNALNPIMSSGGGPVVLGLYANGLSMFAGAVGLIVRNVPGATTVLSAFFALVLLNKLTGTLTLITGGLRLMAVSTTALTASQVANMGVFALMRAEYAAFSATLIGTRIGLAALAVQEWLTAASATAMWTAVTGPVGLVVLAVAAVIAVAVLLYHKWGWFHRAVDNTWDFISTHWKTLGAVLVAPFLLLWGIVKKVFGAIQAIAGFSGGIAGKVGGVLDAINPFAAGGVVGSPLQLVGEHGPELAALPIGTRVVSAPETRQMLRAPRMPTVPGVPAMAGGGSGPVVYELRNVIELDGRVVAERVSEIYADERAAG